MITKTEVKLTERNREIGSAMRSMYCQRVLKQLTDNMLERGATSNDVAIFQSDFCNANDIVIPDSFFPDELSFDDFISEMLVESTINIKAKDVYDSYVEWCKEKGLLCKTKGCFYFELKQRNLCSKTGTISGKTVRNVVKGYEIKDRKMTDDFVEDLRNKANISDVIIDKKCPKCGKELTVSEEKQMYYCFDCKNGGNVFTYIMQTTGKNMKETIEYLSK